MLIVRDIYFTPDESYKRNLKSLDKWKSQGKKKSEKFFLE